jgi:hypothetical protein
MIYYHYCLRMLVLDKFLIDFTNIYLHGEKIELTYAFAYDFKKT